ncbi:hypothetical protein Dip518_001189 [Parelusimicrobium proximum]|uniref:hypothetical protein n=1 Tax=Parelusimicrobium proximum TaxID=3228953 RepID=UPI003D171812
MKKIILIICCLLLSASGLFAAPLIDIEEGFLVRDILAKGAALNKSTTLPYTLVKITDESKYDQKDVLGRFVYNMENNGLHYQEALGSAYVLTHYLNYEGLVNMINYMEEEKYPLSVKAGFADGVMTVMTAKQRDLAKCVEEIGSLKFVMPDDCQTAYEYNNVIMTESAAFKTLSGWLNTIPLAVSFPEKPVKEDFENVSERIKNIFKFTLPK